MADLLRSIEEIAQNPEYSDALKSKLIDAATAQHAAETAEATAKRDAAQQQRQFKWNTPLVIALTGTITIAANFLATFYLDRQKGDVQVNLAQQNAQHAFELRQQELTAQSDQSKLSFQYDIIKSELSTFKTPEERANSLEFLLRVGVLGPPLDKTALSEAIADVRSGKNPNAVPALGQMSSGESHRYEPCANTAALDRITPAFLRKMGVAEGRASDFAVPLRDGLNALGACETRQIAAILSNILFESANFRFLAEPENSPFIARYENRMGNTEPGDGKKYRGRGLLMLTGKDNYRRLSQWLGDPRVLETPDLVASDPALAVSTFVWYFNARDLLSGCTADTCDLRKIRRRINGSVHGLDRVEPLYEKVLEELKGT